MRRAFDIDKELAKAWAWCWLYYCTETEYDGRKLPPRQSWLTATDLERRVRAAAVEQLEGREYGSAGPDAWGSRVRISAGNHSSVLEAARSWLQARVMSGHLTAHNFGRGHISGMRFRPVGMGLTAAEQETIIGREKRNAGKVPVHFRRKERSDWKPLCSPVQKRMRFRRYRSKARLTNDPENVTCPRCKKLLAAQADETCETCGTPAGKLANG